MKKLWILGAVLLVALFGGRAWYLNQTKSKGENVVKVGVLSFPSGEYAKMGQELNSGIILAAEEINASPNYNGIKIDLVMEDGKGIAKEAVNAFHRLQFRHIDGLIVAGDNQVPSVSPLIVQNKIPTVLTISGNEEFTKYNNPKYMYKNYYSGAKSAEQLANYIRTTTSYQKVAVLAMNSVYGLETANGFADTFKAKGGKIVLFEKFRENEVAPQSLVAKVINQKPDAVFIIGYGQAFIALLNKIKEVKYAGGLITDQGIINPESLDGIKEKSDFLFFAQLVKNPSDNRVFEQYKNRFNEKMSNWAQDGYSSMMIFAEAIKNSDKTPEGINTELNKIRQINTIRGKLTIDDKGMGSLPIFIGKMKSDGTYDVLEEKE